MNPEKWWKNFALGIELDIAGTFIYNGIRTLEDLQSFQHPVDTFEILYNLSVGIERLLKIAIILLEHDESIDIESFEKSLISHNTIELANRIDGHKALNLPDLHKEFLSLLSKFYKSHRYSRYSLSAVPNIQEEKRCFLEFISKHLSLSLLIDDEFAFIGNTDQIRKFVGKIVKKISSRLFSIIREEASRLNIYTAEQRADSKAVKVFYGQRLDFIDERIKKKEILLYLMSPGAGGPHIELLRSYGALDLDEGMIPNYIQALLNDRALPFVDELIDELYTEVENVGERLRFVGIMDNEYLSYDPDEEDPDEEA